MNVRELGRQQNISHPNSCTRQEIQEFRSFVKKGPFVDKDRVAQAIPRVQNRLNETYRNAGVLKVDRRRITDAIETTVFDGTAQLQEKSFNRIISIEDGSFTV